MKSVRQLFYLTTLFLCFSGIASLAPAADGVAEINQACAIAGCFSGDAPGFPVTIDGSAGRSYRLTGDLTVPDENTDGIFMTVGDISIDLNQFAIIRAGCTSSTVSCRPTSGTGNGIGQSTILAGYSIMNGSVIGMGANGVIVGQRSIVRNMRTRWNRGAGIRVMDYSSVIENVSTENGTGIGGGSYSTISGNTTTLNSGNGIGTTDGATVSGNTSGSNGFRGIQSGNGTTIQGNTTRNNGADGIQASTGSLVIGNSSNENGTAGILAGPGALVQSNTVGDNGTYGLALNSTTGYRENVISSNTSGNITGSGTNLGNNLCYLVGLCP